MSSSGFNHHRTISIPDAIPMPEGGRNRNLRNSDTEMIDLDLTDSQTTKIAAIHREIDATKNVMIDNINKTIDRGTKLDDLVAISEDLSASARDFKDGTNTLKRQMWWKNFKLWCIILLAIAVIVAIVTVPIILKIKKVI
jgi:hypothetical protein